MQKVNHYFLLIFAAFLIPNIPILSFAESPSVDDFTAIVNTGTVNQTTQGSGNTQNLNVGSATGTRAKSFNANVTTGAITQSSSGSGIQQSANIGSATGSKIGSFNATVNTGNIEQIATKSGDRQELDLGSVTNSSVTGAVNTNVTIKQGVSQTGAGAIAIGSVKNANVQNFSNTIEVKGKVSGNNIKIGSVVGQSRYDNDGRYVGEEQVGDSGTDNNSLKLPNFTATGNAGSGIALTGQGTTNAGREGYSGIAISNVPQPYNNQMFKDAMAFAKTIMLDPVARGAFIMNFAGQLTYYSGDTLLTGADILELALMTDPTYQSFQIILEKSKIESVDVPDLLRVAADYFKKNGKSLTQLTGMQMANIIAGNPINTQLKISSKNKDKLDSQLGTASIIYNAVNPAAIDGMVFNYAAKGAGVVVKSLPVSGIGEYVLKSKPSEFLYSLIDNKTLKSLSITLKGLETELKKPIQVFFREPNEAVARWVKKNYPMKPITIKNKTMKPIDYFLNSKSGAKSLKEFENKFAGKVGAFEPKVVTDKMAEEAMKANLTKAKTVKEAKKELEALADIRKSEYDKLVNDINAGKLNGDDFKYEISKNGTINRVDFKKSSDGVTVIKSKDVVGDYDLAGVRYSDGTKLSKNDLQVVQEQLSKNGVTMHPGVESWDTLEHGINMNAFDSMKSKSSLYTDMEKGVIGYSSNGEMAAFSYSGPTKIDNATGLGVISGSATVDYEIRK